MRTFLLALILSLSSIASPAALAQEERAPEDCWPRDRYSSIIRGQFIFEFDGSRITPAELAQFIGRAREHQFRIEYGAGSEQWVLVTLATPKRLMSTERKRQKVNASIRELWKNTPGVKDVGCNFIEQQEEEEGPGSGVGTIIRSFFGSSPSSSDEE